MEIGEGIDAVGAVYWAQTLQKEEDYDSKVKGMDFDGKKIGFPWDHPRTPPPSKAEEAAVQKETNRQHLDSPKERNWQRKAIKRRQAKGRQNHKGEAKAKE
eukprot:1010950_1